MVVGRCRKMGSDSDIKNGEYVKMKRRRLPKVTTKIIIFIIYIKKIQLSGSSPALSAADFR